MSTTFEASCLEKIEAAEYPILIIPFHGTPAPFMIRELNEAQTLACGNFSLIETLEDKIRLNTKKYNIRDIIAYADRNHAIVRAALIKPTYDQIFEIIGANPKVDENKKELKELKKKLGKTKSGPQRSALEEEIDTLRIWCDFLLPNDFMSYVVSYTLGINKSDIKLISGKIMLDCAILAEKGSNDPIDHCDGRFTPFMRDDFNRRSWIILAEKRKEMKPHGR